MLWALCSVKVSTGACYYIGSESCSPLLTKSLFLTQNDAMSLTTVWVLWHGVVTSLLAVGLVSGWERIRQEDGEVSHCERMQKGCLRLLIETLLSHPPSCVCIPGSSALTVLCWTGLTKRICFSHLDDCFFSCSLELAAW